MGGIQKALGFLAQAKVEVPAISVVFGDDLFLKHSVLDRLQAEVLGHEDGEFSLTVFEADEVELQQVLDCLSTLAMFGEGRRLVFVQQADAFVTLHRAALEEYAAHPSSTGALVLEVASWPASTRLAKKVAADGLTVECSTPKQHELLKWVVDHASKKHRVKFDRAAAEVLLDSVECDLGLLDQEIAKLALTTKIDGTVNHQMVRELVGGWRTKTTWDMLDLAVAGNAPQALVELDRLLAGGENPIPILAQIGSSLRRMATAVRFCERAQRSGRRSSLREALTAAGVSPHIVGKVEPQMKQIGPQRSVRLYRWLLDADLALKGSHSTPARARTVLEQLIARLSKVASTTSL